MHRRIVMSGLAMVATTAGALTGMSQAASAAGGSIKVAWEAYGSNVAITTLMHTAAGEFAKQYPGWKVNLDPIVAPENAYYTKLSLENSSASTAPDVMYEDTFLVNSDVAAGYLQPMDKFLASWPQWKLYSKAAQAAAKGSNGHVYGVSMGTDTRGLWYNKALLTKAGVTVPWHPKTWGDVVAAAAAVKAHDPGVTPINIYSGVGTGEASTMQGFEMFLYGTNNWLYDFKTDKWEMAGAGWQAVLNTWRQLFTKGLAESPQAASDPNNGTAVGQQLLPQGKLAIDLDGSWLSGSNWLKGGSAPWPQWNQVLGIAPMPTQGGQGAGDVSMSGGWLLSIGSHSKNAQMAANFIKIALDKNNLLYYDINAGQIADRSDVRVGPVLHGVEPIGRCLLELRALHPFPPCFQQLPQALQRDPADNGPNHDQPDHSCTGRGQLQQVPGQRGRPSQHRGGAHVGFASQTLRLDQL